MSTTTPATAATKRSTINDDHDDHETNNRHDEKKHDHATHTDHEHSGHHHHHHHPIHHVTQQMRQISVLSVPKRIQPKYSFVSIDEECNRRHHGASSVVTATATATETATAVKETATETETTTTTTTEASKSAFTLLTQFYNELMIPTFPLEEERDDLDDWFLCFREQQMEEERSRKQKCAAGEVGDAAVASFLGPAMDVVLMLLNNDNDNDNDNDNESNNKPIIIGGAAIEYYKQSQVGLLSYIVLHEEYRGCGLSKVLHQEALRRLNRLSNCYYYCPNNTADNTTTASTTNNNTTTPNTTTNNTKTAAKTNTTRPPLQAIFAETNTPAAGDVSPAQSLLRHKALYHLGYRLVKFPYAQPPLTTEELNGSFDDIVLLVYFPFVVVVGGGGGGGDIIIDGKDGVGKEEIVGRYCPWFLEWQQQQQEPPQREKQHQQQQQSNAHERLTNGSNNKKSNSSNGAEAVKMNVNIPFQYVKDFYQSVFGYDDDNSRKEQNDATGSIGSGGNKNDNDDGDGSQEEIPDYRTANYYRLAHWFTHVRSNKKSEKNDTDDNGNTNGGNDENASSMVDVSLLSPPWEDCMESLSLEWKEWENRRKNM